MSSIKLVGLALVTASSVFARSITLHNNCPFTIWPAFYTGDTGQGTPSGPTGFSIAQGGPDYQLTVPDNWTAGRIWARTACDFSKQDVQACETGSCVGGEQCTQPGVPPVTLAEFTLSQSGEDNYDVSNVDGSNIPVSITGSRSAGACTDVGCYTDLNANCPDALKLTNSAGATVGCKSACLAFGTETDCCSGAHNTLETCPSSGVQYYDYFHGNCPKAYAYAYDDVNGLVTCSGGPSYTVTFCP